MKKELNPLVLLGLAVLFYVAGLGVGGSETFFGAVVIIFSFILLLFAIVGGIRWLVKH